MTELARRRSGDERKVCCELGSVRCMGCGDGACGGWIGVGLLLVLVEGSIDSKRLLEGQ